MQRGKKPKWVQELAKERMEKLLKMAKQNASKYPDRSKRYVQLARKLSMRYNVTIPKLWKRKFCKKCNVFWTSKTLKISKDKKTKLKIYECKKCGSKKKHP